MNNGTEGRVGGSSRRVCRFLPIIFILCGLVWSCAAGTPEDTERYKGLKKEVESLKRENADLRKQLKAALAKAKPAPIGPEPLPETGITEGKLAPDFTLQSNKAGPVTLSSFRGKSNVVLYFYPRDETPGCTVQACKFRDTRDDFKGHDTVVIGISVDDLTSHAKFAKKHNLNFTLLADPAVRVTSIYGVKFEMRGAAGVVRFAKRVTFVIDKRGVIRKRIENPNPVVHVDESLKFIRGKLDK